jgi:hypothetical protein
MKKIDLCEEEEKNLIDLSISRLTLLEILLERLKIKDGHVWHELTAAVAHLSKIRESKENKKGRK